MSQAQTYIDKFNNLHGKCVYKKDVVDMLAGVKATKLPELKEVEKKLSKIASKMNGKPMNIFIQKPLKLKVKKVKKIKKTSLAAPPKMPIKKVMPAVVKIVPEIKKPVTRSNMLNGVVDASAIAGLNFSRIELDGKYKQDFLRMYSDTQMMVWGMPGHGKTVYLLQFAQYLAEKKNIKVLYLANEEMNRSTFTEKIRDFKIGHSNLKFAKTLAALKTSGKSIQDFDAVFFDSIQSLGFNLDTYKKFVEENPGRIYVLIAQATKEGDFRGGQEWEHEVDIAGIIVNRRLILRKNRLDNEFAKKSDKLMMDEKVNEGKKKLHIREEIRKTLKPKEEGNIIMQ